MDNFFWSGGEENDYAHTFYYVIPLVSSVSDISENVVSGKKYYSFFVNSNGQSNMFSYSKKVKAEEKRDALMWAIDEYWSRDRH